MSDKRKNPAAPKERGYIKSKYIKERMCTRWENQQHIDDLCFLEKGIRKGFTGMAANLKFFNLTRTHEREYIILLEELAPKQLEIFLKQKKKEERERYERDIQRSEMQTRDEIQREKMKREEENRLKCKPKEEPDLETDCEDKRERPFNIENPKETFL